MTAKKVTGIALLAALGTAAGFFPAVPFFGARLFPAQHAINVLAAVFFGPGPAVLVAFIIAVLRNLLAVGTVLAFPGGMVGAMLAGWVFRCTRKDYAAAAGEVCGTGVLGALLSVPLARLILGNEALAFTYIVPFTLSSVAGAAVALAILRIIFPFFRRS
ncbi:MAG TPA: energy coupling factor transporter S component ThiW [Firmicutes bacterium]|nr:energy coupling factor transporter S component ThiW [Bacillota bacterium]